MKKRTCIPGYSKRHQRVEQDARRLAAMGATDVASDIMDAVRASLFNLRKVHRGR